MYLSDNELIAALDEKRLIVSPRPEAIGSTSIDLTLDSVSEARVWDMDRYNKDVKVMGFAPFELNLGDYDYREFSQKYLVPPSDATDQLVQLEHKRVIIRPGGLVLWQTKEIVGTPEEDAELICFIDGKSTKARAGILVHLTAPTIHASWRGNVTLEIHNVGPFHLVLREGDAIAQITVAQISSAPTTGEKASGSSTVGQSHVTGEQA